MNSRQAKELLPIMQAFAEGKVIEYYCNNIWTEYDNFNFLDKVQIIVSSPNPSTAHLLTKKNVGRKCKSISRSDGSRTKKMVITH